jgi:hypothetical protein
MRLRRPSDSSRARPTVPPPEVDGEESRREDEARGFVARLRLRGLSTATIVAAVRANERFGFGESRTRRLIREALEGFRDEANANVEFSKGEQIARVREELAVLLEPQHKTVQRRVVELDARGRERTRVVEERVRVAPHSQSIARLEELLADLEGNRTPVKIADVAGLVAGAAAAVFAAMDDGRALAMLERARERRRLAAAVASEPRRIGAAAS